MSSEMTGEAEEMKDDEDEEEMKDRYDDGGDEGFSVLSDLPVEITERRPTCHTCCRPVKVCLCPYLPTHPLDVSTCLYIVQHPAEESRVLRTVPLLAACLPPVKCKVFIGRRFTDERHPELAAVCKDAHTLLLYPGAAAADLEDLASDFATTYHNVILIDGTWSQAKDMFLRNSLFRLPKQVQLRSISSSQYVIRTQPTNMCVSTLECAAVVLSIIEKNQNIQEVLLKPLQALCSFQLQHGAQIHHSKEHLIRNGQYNKILPQNKRKIRRMQKLISNPNI
ncbi:tRNA-uridine aminocarboxypropyltransferase 2 [Triplophysa dalaica]|uniref:tRNA-uridine aminocarboxypropyltransferase 2 n=1 Tax=Triplophysa dalaica TaxID=1582913 RepID=UPI0024DF8688|nr:tRNA-uridine aminocarboxypropyltransferase 2 [Triplophysa dalaica]